MRFLAIPPKAVRLSAGFCEPSYPDYKLDVRPFVLPESSGTQMTMNFVSYVRVSTMRQGRSGLGMEAQKTAVDAYVRRRGILVAEFVEVETGKGSNALARRPQLRDALNACKKHGAVLLIAKLDRLARNVHFISGLIETGCDFVAADMPEANKVMIQMHAVMSEWERDQISARTKAALAVARDRGVVLGATGPTNLHRNLQERQRIAAAFADRHREVIAGFRARSLTHRGMVFELNGLGLRTPNGGRWSVVQVQRLLHRLQVCTTTTSEPPVVN